MSRKKQRSLSEDDVRQAVAHIKRALALSKPEDITGAVYCRGCNVGHWFDEPLPEGCTLLDDISTNQPK